MQPFLSEEFLLQTETSKRLYHDYAENQPIFDYHCHLPIEDIANNRHFLNMTQIWLYGDHYKWLAMRANGISEAFITGPASDHEKFSAWATTVPKTLRNPLYHWTHIELKKPFGIEGVLLNAETADSIYSKCSEMLVKPEFSTCGLLQQMKVKVVCTTDDPIDSLEHHKKIAAGDFCFARVFPAFRPDNAMAVEVPKAYNTYLALFEASADYSISTYRDLISAIQKRHDYFQENGCRLSDHGVEQPYAENFTDLEIEDIFLQVRSGKEIELIQIYKFKSAALLDLARMDAVLYNLNPRDNELLAAMTGNYQDSSIPGKMQFGSAWWFNDLKDGMERQINSLPNLGLLSSFVGIALEDKEGL